jgi:hypothetical protein
MKKLLKKIYERLAWLIFIQVITGIILYITMLNGCILQ